MAGHSLGEYTALVAAGAIGFREAVRLVHKRGQYMAEAVSPGSGLVAAVLGLSELEVSAVCQEAEVLGVVAPANLNSPGQTVIAGEKSAVERALELAKTRGAKRVKALPVSVPVHTSLMQVAADRLKKDIDSASAIEALNEYVTVTKVFQDVGNNSGDAVLNAENTTAISKSSKTKTDGPIITVVPLDFTTFPKTTTIDYQSGILCKDGITRKGIVTVVSTDWYGKQGSEHTTTFDNYYHEGFKVEGTHYVKNLGLNQDENLEYSVTIDDGKIITGAGDTINYTENSTRTWVAGFNTPLNIWDDEYLLEGTQSGTSSKNVDYSLTIEEALHFVLLPRSIKFGILDIDVANINDIKINYTNSTITILGMSYPFGN